MMHQSQNPTPGCSQGCSHHHSSRLREASGTHGDLGRHVWRMVTDVLVPLLQAAPLQLKGFKPNQCKSLLQPPKA